MKRVCHYGYYLMADEIGGTIYGYYYFSNTFKRNFKKYNIALGKLKEQTNPQFVPTIFFIQ